MLRVPKTLFGVMKQPKCQLFSEEEENDSEFRSYHDLVAQALAKLQADIQENIRVSEVAIAAAEHHRRQWQIRKNEWDKQFQIFLEEAGGEQVALSRQRTKLAKEVEELKERRQNFLQLAETFPRRVEEYESLLDDLIAAKKRLYEARSAIYIELTQKSSGRLRLNLKADADHTRYARALEQLFRGMSIQERFREQLAQSMTPRVFVKAVLENDHKILEDQGKLTNAASTKIVNGIPANDDLLRQLLSIPYKHMPEDVPEILYQKEDTNYYPLAELSVGQKCTALMLIALSEGELPIIIDQPEDALDVATVYKDVVQRLRAGKDQRQFIITTHNPNVAVSSDSDKYHVLKGTATTSGIVCAGAIDLQNVASEVIDHLEGGVEPYRLRGQKYNV